MESINGIYKQLHGKTVSQVIKIVKESLIQLFIIKHIISTVFKKHFDVLTLLLKSQPSLAPPNISNDDDSYQTHYIASITLPPVSRYTSADIAFFMDTRNHIKHSDHWKTKSDVMMAALKAHYYCHLLGQIWRQVLHLLAQATVALKGGKFVLLPVIIPIS